MPGLGNDSFFFVLLFLGCKTHDGADGGLHLCVKKETREVHICTQTHTLGPARVSISNYHKIVMAMWKAGHRCYNGDGGCNMQNNSAKKKGSSLCYYILITRLCTLHFHHFVMN